MENRELNPSKILEIGFGFWPAKVLLSAVELGLFTKLGDRSVTGETLAKELGVHPRGIWDFFDTLVALGLLNRKGNGTSALYSNTPESAAFLNRNDPHYIGGIFEMAESRLYKFWGDLTTALKTGKPQNELKHSNRSMFEELYSDPARLEQFMDAMRGLSLGNFVAFTKKFNFAPYKTLCDVGGATGLLASLVAKEHSHMKCATFDLPEVKPIAQKWVAREGLADQVDVLKGNFLTDPLPKADIITMGMILHDWSLEHKKLLLKRAFDALPKGGAFVAIECIIDDERRKNAFGLMMSLNMLIEFGDAFDFTGADFWSWCKEVGFARYEVIHLAGPSSAAVAYKE